MKRKILSVLGVLTAVLVSTAALSACNKAPAGLESGGGSGESMSAEQGGEPSVSEGREAESEALTEETADQKIEFSYSYTDSDSKERTEICSLLVPNRWTFEEKPFGGTFSESGNKILDITILPERERESLVASTKELDTKIIGSYEYYVDSYETNILEWDDTGGDKHFSLYTLNEYSMLANGNLYFFRFFCRADSPVITEDDCSRIISTFIITE